MSKWRASLVVTEHAPRLRFRHLITRQENGTFGALCGTIASVTAPDGAVAVGIGMKVPEERANRAMGRTVAGGRALRALAAHMTPLTSIKGKRDTAILKNEAFYRLFVLLTHADPCGARDRLAFIRKLQKRFPEVSLDFVKRLEASAEVMGFLNEAILTAILSNDDEVKRIESIEVIDPRSPPGTVVAMTRVPSTAESSTILPASPDDPPREF